MLSKVKRKEIRKRIIKRTKREKKKENEIIRASLYIIFERKKYCIERRVN